MKFFEKYKFLKRTTKIPYDIFTKSSSIWLKWRDLDLITKLFNYNHFNEGIFPDLNKLAKRSWYDIKTITRSTKDLEWKWLLKINKTNSNKKSFDLSNIYSEIVKQNNQLYINFDDNSIGGLSNDLSELPYITIPKSLDYFQWKLWLKSWEIIFLKYLFWFLDTNLISNVSLNTISKITPISRTSLTSYIKNLESKWLIITKEVFHWRTKIRKTNRYDLKPLLEKLNELERIKSKDAQIKNWTWVDYNKQRTHRTLSEINLPKEKVISPEEKQDRMNYLENEIRNIKFNSYISKYSDDSCKIRAYEEELSNLKWDSPSSFSDILRDRFNNLAEWSKSNLSSSELEAKDICDKLWWNWDRSRNMYFKAIKILWNSVYRHMTSAIELANNPSKRENYFATIIKNEITNKLVTNN